MGELNLYDCEGGRYRGSEPGWSVRTNSRGIVVSRIRYWEIEERSDPVWETVERKRLGDQDFELQQGETYDVPVGAPYYPIFAQRTHEVAPLKFEGYYVRDAPAVNLKLPLIVGLDGGQERPACIVKQWFPEYGILWAMRELAGPTVKGFQAGEFVSLLRYLLGLATEEQLYAEQRSGRWNTARALDWIATEKRERWYGWDMPWLPPGHGVRVYCVMAKHEALQKNQMARDVELNSLRKLYVQQDQRMALHLNTAGWDHRDIVAGFLMREGRIPGVPRGIFDSSCKWLLKGLSGGLVQPPPSQKTGGPLRDRKFEDAHDAWLNGACAAFPLQFADRLKATEAAELRARQESGKAAMPPQHGLRWTPSSKIAGASWGGVRLNYQENANA